MNTQMEIEAAANARIGELVREGETVYYAILSGGIYTEDTARKEVLAFVLAEERNA